MKKVLFIVGIILISPQIFSQNISYEIHKESFSVANEDFHFWSDEHTSDIWIDKKIQKKCLSIKNEIFLNSGKCENIKFSLSIFDKDMNLIKDFLNKVSLKICPNSSYKLNEKLKKPLPLMVNIVKGTFNCNLDLLAKEEKRIKEENEEKEQLAKEESENKIKKEKQESILASVNEKRELCFSMGFKDNTDPLANCVLQLMLNENKKQQVVSNDSSSDEMLDVLDNQTQIMERQLRLQKIERNQRNMKSFQYMIDNGALPPGGFGN